MNANWYGILPRWVRQKFGHVGTEMIGGIVGSEQEHHAAPYSITEEFVSVYRLHPLLPDDYEIRDHRDGSLVAETDFEPIQGHGTRPTIVEHGWSNLLYSFGDRPPRGDHPAQPPEGARQPRPPQRRPRRPGDDRHRSRPRARRAALQRLPREAAQEPDQAASRISPTIPELAEEIRDVYDGDIDRVDLQVGMLAEPLPPGFGFSDTAFRIFILMASRRLQVRPLLHQRLLAGRLHARGPRLGREQHDGRRAAAPPPRARAGARRLRERVRALARASRERAVGRVAARERALQRASSSSRTRCRASFGRRRAAVAAATRANVDGQAVGLLRGMQRRPRRRPGLGPRGPRPGAAAADARPTSTARSRARPTRSRPTRSPSATGWSPSSPTR